MLILVKCYLKLYKVLNKGDYVVLRSSIYILYNNLVNDKNLNLKLYLMVTFVKVLFNRL